MEKIYKSLGTLRFLYCRTEKCSFWLSPSPAVVVFKWIALMLSFVDCPSMVIYRTLLKSFSSFVLILRNHCYSSNLFLLYLFPRRFLKMKNLLPHLHPRLTNVDDSYSHGPIDHRSICRFQWFHIVSLRQYLKLFKDYSINFFSPELLLPSILVNNFIKRPVNLYHCDGNLQRRCTCCLLCHCKYSL